MNDMPAFDPSIPVLTEVFHEQQASQPAPPAPVAPAHEDRGVALEARAIDGWTEPEWTLIERRVSERVLRQLQDRIDVLLEQRVRDSMEEVLNGVLAALTSEIRAGLHQAIETTVTRAVAQEVAHLQALKK